MDLEEDKAFVEFISTAKSTVNAKSNPMNGQSTTAFKIFYIRSNLPCNN